MEILDSFVVVLDFVQFCLLVARVVHVEGIVMLEHVVIVVYVVCVLIEHIVLNPVPKQAVKRVLLSALISCRFLGVI